MLGRLIQSYSKGSSNLESTTEEAHSRSLLWPTHPQSFDHGRGLLSSPPTTPVGSPTFRMGPFDDRGGLEVNESKDVRVIIAQDAFGSMDRPTVLFDTQHQRAGSVARNDQPIPGSSQQQPLQQSLQQQQRNRSTTVSGPSAAWSRPNRELENNDKVHRLLDCMFGVTSATKSESSTKMHVLTSGSSRPPSSVPPSPSLQKSPLSRAPLNRSRTAYQINPAQKPADSAKDDKLAAEDVVLVTRMFTVTLPESKEQIPRADESPSELSPMPSGPRSDSFGAGKRPKLVEKKIPMYAVGLLITLPPEDLRSHVSRPPSRTSFTSSFPSSLGSDIASSWTLLDSIPDLLSSSTHSQKRADRRIELLTDIWDVILRSLTHVEHLARIETRNLLEQVNHEIMASMVKTPKGPHEQRTNQRNVYIRTHLALADSATLYRSCRQVLQRISTALRVPRVVTGTGFLEGHWLDEARYLDRICGSRTHNFFLFRLLTAFLGNHTEWLEKLGSRQPMVGAQRGQYQSQRSGFLASHTVIVADRRSVARRLIFLLASFLPTSAGASALEKDLMHMRSPLSTPGLPSSSPLRQSFNKASEIGQGRQHHIRNQHVSFSTTNTPGPPTSSSFDGGCDSVNSVTRSRPGIGRKDSENASIRTTSMFPISNTSLHLRKASAANSATTPNASDPITYFAAKGDSYFPEDAIVDGSETVASADLARILRRDSGSIASTGIPSPKWPALLSGFWNKRPDTADDSSSHTSARKSSDQPRRGSVTSTSQPSQSGNKLESMVSEANGVDVPRPRNAMLRSYQDSQLNILGSSEAATRSVQPPRLRVDKEDGVIDVDVGMAGFMSWEGDSSPVSPPRDHQASSSHHSLDGVASLRSSVSRTTGQPQSSGGESLSVAGFLKKYHEDFVLQAVKPYDELLDDVKQSMLREASYLDEFTDSTPDAEDLDAEEWFDVCSTLVADLRKHSVEHIVLRRRRSKQWVSSDEQTQDVDYSKTGYSSAEQKFLVETVVNYDTILTDAIESILYTTSRHGGSAAGTTSTHKRTTSSSTTASTSTSTPPASLPISYNTSPLRPQHLHADCRQIIAEALEEVVQSVKDDLNQYDEARPLQSQPHNQKHDVSEENVLRDGVRRWLLKEEPRRVW